jgi:uncharacterized membrane protein YeiB
MEPTQEDPGAVALAPVSRSERIETLDVVRGFALLGIFLMNVEWFNRAFSEMSMGLPVGLTGADWWASRLIYVLVQGKFWTIFSLLFGMGFAVMLTRAERAGRGFLRPYLRRIAALAVFGVAHHILLWGGDILFSYAVAALALLILLYGKWKPMVAALVVLVGLGFIPKLDPLWAVAGSLAFVGMAALFLRGEKQVTIRGRSLPVFSAIVLVIGILAAMAAAVLWSLPQGPREPRVPVTVVAVAILAIGVLSARFHAPVEARPRRLGIALYLLPFLLMTVFGAVMYVAPDLLTGARPAASVPADEAGRKALKAEADRKARQDAERAERIRKQQEKIRTETQVHSRGSFRDAARQRALEFRENAPNDAVFATIVIGMFLLGTWFIRSGAMENSGDHLPLFRTLAWVGVPVGVGLGILGAALCSSHVPGNMRDGFQLANGLMMIGNLPACLGYVSLVVLALHSGSWISRIRILAPVGRMALTNYLLQSAVSALFFFGYGLGHWGMGRAWQVVYVAVVFLLQVAFSHWWLGRFRYGPMEWLWRAITYWKLPAMKLEPAGDILRPAEAPAP